MEKKTPVEVKAIVCAQVQKSAGEGEPHQFDGGMWTRIFIQVYGYEPCSYKDHLWDELLHDSGFNGLKIAYTFIDSQRKECQRAG